MTAIRPTSRTWLIGGVGIALVAALVFALFSLNGSSKADVTVNVIEGAGGNAKTSEFTSVDEALRYASGQAGFEVKTPELPAGYALDTVVIPPKPPIDTGGIPRRVMLNASKGEQSFSILQVNHHYDFPGKDADHLLPLSSLGDFYKVPADTMTFYTLLTEDRGYGLDLPSSVPFDDAEAVKILESMAQ